MPKIWYLAEWLGAVNSTPVSKLSRVSIQGVKSVGSHFACLCRYFDSYEVKKKYQKENGKTFTLLIMNIVKSLQKSKY